MVKLRYLFFLMIILSGKDLQSQINFTITNNSGSNTITCLIPSLNLVATSDYTASALTYSWSGPFGSWINNSYAATTPGIYTITALTGSISSSQTLAVYANTIAPQFIITPTLQNISCSVSSLSQVSITVSSPANSISQKIITPYGGYYVPNTSSHTYFPFAPGTYSFISTNLQNGCVASKNFQVSSSAGFPTFTITSPQNFKIGCLSQSLALTQIGNPQTSPPGGFTSYTLVTASSGSVPVTGSLGSITQYSFTSPLNFTILVRDNSTSCEARVPISIINNTIGPLVSVSPQFPVLSCLNTSLQLVAGSSEQNATYTWTDPSLTVSQGSVCVAVANLAQAQTNTVLGNYTVTVTDNASLCKTQSVVSVYQNIYKPNVAITFGFDDTLTCASQTITIVNNSSTGIPPGSAFPSTLGINTVAWFGPAPQNSLASLSSYALNTPGIYTLVAKDGNNGCTGSGTINVADARDIPVLQPLPLVCLGANGSAVLWPTVVSTDTLLAYNWTAPANYTLIATGSASQSVNSTGVFTLEVFNSGGCSSQNTYSVSDCVSLSQHNKEPVIKLIPNPFSEGFTIIGEFAGAELQVFDLTGKCLATEIVFSGIKVNAGDLEPGIYFARIMHQGRSLYSTKVIKE